MSKLKLQEELLKLKKQQDQLLAKKSKSGLSKDEQSSLDELVSKIFDINELVETYAEVTQPTESGAFVPKDGEDHLVHAELMFGKKFDSETGAEISSPYMQKFSVEEFNQFEKTAPSLGYSVKVIYKPEAKA